MEDDIIIAPSLGPFGYRWTMFGYVWRAIGMLACNRIGIPWAGVQ